MKILVFGSLNIDRTYSVEHFVQPGETMTVEKMGLFCGGKGFNQAVALRRAGNAVSFAGAVGRDGNMLLDALDADGVDRRMVVVLDVPTGHAVIQVDAQGQNCIIVQPGANGEITLEQIDSVLDTLSPGDLIVLQNEISHMPQLLQRAREKGLVSAFNPSPINGRLALCDLALADYLLINETEGAALSGRDAPEEMLAALHAAYPNTNIVLTLGGEGSLYMSARGERAAMGILPVRAVDTTAAGDTFTGYFLSEMMRSGSAPRALRLAAAASGLAVSRMGASPSIPRMDEVLAVVDQVPSAMH